MNLSRQLLHQINDQGLSTNKRAQLRCQLAKQLEEAGNFEAAREAMGEFWQRVGEHPALEGLDQETAGEVLLRAGALTGWIGSTKQIEGSQEAAKDLITESLSIFSSLGNTEKLSAAQTDLAYCYWREGAFDEARVILQEALARLAHTESETRALALLRSGIVEGSAQRFHDALRIFTEAAPLIEKSSDLFLGGKFHHSFGTLLKKLGEAEQRLDYIDRAFIEFAAASFHFEQAGQPRHEACVENNLGFLFCTIGKLAEAHEHLDRAQMLLTRLKDDVHLAQVDETRARVMLAEGRVVEAEKTVGNAVRTLEKGDELSLLAEALTTQGVALARLHHAEKARAALNRAAEVAEQAGDPESAGVAALALIEELGQDFSSGDARATINRAEILLEKTQDMAIVKRLAKAALRALLALLAPPDWTNFFLRRVVERYEEHWIKLALQETGGLVTRAARLLGFKHHQSLISLINIRHKDLLETRSDVRKRRRHLIVHPKRAARKPADQVRNQTASQISILHVEDNAMVAKMVQDSLEFEGWQVETCADGNTAMEKIAGAAHYDLLLLDYELPGMNGVQLVQHARSLAHRRRTPIIILSATLDEEEARIAGADAFLRKPEDIAAVTETVAQLVKSVKEGS